MDCTTTDFNTVKLKEEQNLEVYEIERVPQFNYECRRESVELTIDNLEPCEESLNPKPDPEHIKEEPVESKPHLEIYDYPLYQPNFNKGQHPPDIPRKELLVQLERLKLMDDVGHVVARVQGDNKSSKSEKRKQVIFQKQLEKLGSKNLPSTPNYLTPIKIEEATVPQDHSSSSRTKKNRNSKLHLRRYGDSRQVNKFKIEKRNFQTVPKDSLKGYEVIHKNPEQISLKTKIRICKLFHFKSQGCRSGKLSS